MYRNRSQVNNPPCQICAMLLLCSLRVACWPILLHDRCLQRISMPMRCSCTPSISGFLFTTPDHNNVNTNRIQLRATALHSYYHLVCIIVSMPSHQVPAGCTEHRETHGNASQNVFPRRSLATMLPGRSAAILQITKLPLAHRMAEREDVNMLRLRSRPAL